MRRRWQKSVSGHWCWYAWPRGGWPAAIPTGAPYETCWVRLCSRYLEAYSLNLTRSPYRARPGYDVAMSMTFAERLARAQQASGSLVCVGLDPDPAKLPKDLCAGGDTAAGDGTALLYAFNRRIVDAT